MYRFLSLFVLTLLLTSTARAQLTPAEGMKTFTVADGLQIELFAAEPDVINPTSIDIDEKGRVWVCEGVNYRRIPFGRKTLREEGDRIVVLVDETGEGKATKAVTFYQGKEIIAPLGIAVAPYPNPDKKGAISYKVFVCQSPDILLFEDKDGDLKADGPPKKFLTGFRGIDHDHGVHGINIGPDGKLYFTVGDSGVGGLQASDGKGPKFTSNDKDIQKGTVWRCDMDGKNLELIAHNFRNNYECCVNSFGEIWLSDNDDDGNQQTRICHVMPGGNYGYGPRGAGQTHWHEEQPGIVHKVLRTGFGSPTGICFYEGNLLPKKYHGQLLHTDAGPRELRAFHIKPKGAGFEAEKENLVTSTDTWFRLSDVCVAPDGSVILADWYDSGVGGHGMGDWTRGRIYRVTPKGHKGYKVPESDLETKNGIVKAIANPCLALRSLANARLDAMKVTEAAQTLVPALTKDTELSLVARVNWSLTRHMTNKKTHDEIEATFKKFLTDPSQGVGKKYETEPELLCFLIRLRTDNFSNLKAIFPDMNLASPFYSSDLERPVAARREMLVQLRLYQADAVKAFVLKCAELYDGQDHFYRAALNIACGTDPARRDAILADFEKHFPEWNDKVADLVWELRPKSMLPKMEKLLADAKLSGTQRARIIDILSAGEDASAGKAMLNLLMGEYPPEVKTRAIDNLKLFLQTKWKGLQKSKELEAAIDGLLKNSSTQVNGLQLVAAAGSLREVEAVRRIAENKGAAIETRKEAVRTLGKLKSEDAADSLDAVVTFDTDAALRLEAIRALGAQITGQPKDAAGTRAFNVLKAAFTIKDMPVELRQAALSALTGSQVGTQWLLDIAEKKQLPDELFADAGKMLRNSPYQGLRNKAMLLFPPPGKLDPKKLPPISVLAQRSGNVERGKQLMAESFKGVTQCLKCHTVRGIGGNIGPDLSMIGKKASKENLFESILLPNKAIADQYLQWQIENSAGQKILGLIIEENASGITIRDANGKDTKLAKDDIEKRTKSLVSIMPEDIVKGFTEDDLIDVVAYLFTLKTASLTPESWFILGPFDNGENDKGLDTAYEPEKKPIDLSAVFKGKTGPVKWSTIKHDGTGYVNLAARNGPGSSTDTTSYVYQQFESPTDQDATILLGNDDGAKIFLNGTEVFVNRDHFAATPEKHKIPVKLKKGVNSLLMKIVNGNDPHGFYLSIASNDELKLTPIK